MDKEGLLDNRQDVSQNAAFFSNDISGANKTQQFKKEISNNEDKNEILDENSNKENIPNGRPYVPGDFTEPKQRPPSHDQLVKTQLQEPKVESPHGYPRYRDDFSRKSPEPQKDLSEQVNDFVGLNRAMKNATYGEIDKKKESNGCRRLLSPIRAAISNFTMAKKLHRENLEHDPLPDTITHAMYRKLQMQRDKEPGMALDDDKFACGIGWKGYPGYGPNRCTKMKVFRPKTCDHYKKKEIDDSRPSSVSSFDKKWRFIRQSKVSPIDLAICWDLVPEDPKDEPKRPTHIDGSNGSLAPAVFSLVHTPKDESDEIKNCDGIHGCGPIFDHGARAHQEKDFIFDRPRTTHSTRSSSTKSDEIKKRSKSAQNIHDESRRESNLSKTSSDKLKKSKVHQSTPNLSESSEQCKQHSCRKLNNRICVACELKNAPNGDKRPKTEYKMAFKAGIPQKYKAKRDDYPEHWRLATVYQHSYKPVHTRKRPLLQTVFK